MMSLEDEDVIAAQLHSTLQQSVTRALSSRRPLLTHLNADTTWLLSIPLPPASSPSPSTPPKDKSKKAYYHILIDPWLRGGQSDVAAFFSQQWHKEPSAVQTVVEIEEAIEDIECVARGLKDEEQGEEDLMNLDTDKGAGDNNFARQRRSWIDLVLISHEFTDHMHKPTLLEIPSSVPVYATTKAHAAIKSWGHFTNVGEIPRFTGDWRDSIPTPTNGDGNLFPTWLGISRVAKPGVDLLYYHSAIMVTFPYNTADSVNGKGEVTVEAEAVIYTPHGITPADLAPVSTSSPKIHTLALLHGLQDISLPKAQLNKGAHNGLKAQRLLRAKYWVGTHDEVKTGGGIVSWFLKRQVITLKEAMERERKEKEEVMEVRFEDVGNGESLILE